jgi:hypothetical protein
MGNRPEGLLPVVVVVVVVVEAGAEEVHSFYKAIAFHVSVLNCFCSVHFYS